MTLIEQPLSYADYLDAKKPVDDRALNRHVLGAVRRGMNAVPDPVRVLDIGAGLGTMLARLVDWGILLRAEYSLLDNDAGTLAQAPRWLAQWAERSGRRAVLHADVLEIRGGQPHVEIDVRFTQSSVEAFLKRSAPRGSINLLVANAFLDLVDVPAVLPQLLPTLAPEGLYWFSTNFDGATCFEPPHPADAALLGRYHHGMDVRVRDGHAAGASTGRHLFAHLRAAGATIHAAGASDGVVHSVGGQYPDRDRAFVAHILHTIEVELSRDPSVDPELLREWSAARRAQLVSGELVYITRQIDFAGGRAPT